MRRALGALLVVSALGACAGPEDPSPPGGGRPFEPSFATFASDVEPVLVARGCDATVDCHGGGIRGTFELSAPDEKDVAFDFEQARLQADPWYPERSTLLTAPLAADAGGTAHGIKVFMTTEDPQYQAILAWIRAGAGL